jgi:hypothetical protein
MIAPTGIRFSAGFASGTFSNVGLNAPGNDDLTKVAALSQAIAGRTSSPSAVDSAAFVNLGSRNDPDYDSQNMQAAKAAFLSTAQKQKSEDYLHSTACIAFLLIRAAASRRPARSRSRSASARNDVRREFDLGRVGIVTIRRGSKTPSPKESSVYRVYRARSSRWM